MKKEINFLMVYLFTVLIATITAIKVENERSRSSPTAVVKAVFNKLDTDWTNIHNPRKKAYLEHLYYTKNK